MDEATRISLALMKPKGCPHCSRQYISSEIHDLPPEHGQQLRWVCSCGYCGLIYTIEVEA